MRISYGLNRLSIKAQTSQIKTSVNPISTSITVTAASITPQMQSWIYPTSPTPLQHLESDLPRKWRFWNLLCRIFWGGRGMRWIWCSREGFRLASWIVGLRCGHHDLCYGMSDVYIFDEIRCPLFPKEDFETGHQSQCSNVESFLAPESSISLGESQTPASRESSGLFNGTSASSTD